MKDYIEILAFFGYDTSKAQDYVNEQYKFQKELIDEILSEAGLD